MSKELENLRKRIDEIDFEILQNLAERFLLVSKITKYKTKNNLPIFAGKREKEIIKMRKNLARKLKLGASMAEKIFKIILKESRNRQKNDH